ncbi:MAG: LptE family protein [Bacteroidota bacterium]
MKYSLGRYPLLLLLVAVFFTACKYSFKGISIPPDVNTFYVANFDNNAPDALPTFRQTFAEELRDKIRNESRLNYDNTNPDIEFQGTITGYDISSVAPQPDETTAFNRLTITVSIQFINNKDEEANWTESFSDRREFGTDQNLIDVQDQLLEEMTEQLVELIFNKAFTNW